MRTGRFTVQFGETTHRVATTPGGLARVDDGAPLELVAGTDGGIRVRDGGLTRHVFVAASGDRRQVFVDGEVYDLVVVHEDAARPRAGRPAPDLLTAPMPARVTAVLVEAGQAIRKGDVLLKLEAMKMELAIRAPRDGRVLSVACRTGEMVQPGVGLLELS